MSRILEAWLHGAHVGRFITDGDEVRFEYDATAPDTPISLSLPRHEPPTRNAAANYLRNLVPDDDDTRMRLARTYGATSTSVFALLSAAGGDIAGGLQLLPEGQAPATRVPLLEPALDQDIADRIRSIRRDIGAWAPPGRRARFSLAGTQGKFALARISGDWYWSTASVPSTHIVKPGRPELHGIDLAEAAALTLAARAGIPAPTAGLLAASGEAAFVVERFDRAPIRDGLARRIHTEDIAQALGLGPDRKYDVTAKQVIELLRRSGSDGTEPFIRQLAFNTIIGNADAHAKNYSLVLADDRITLAPLYDAVPVGLYPDYHQELAMRIAGARLPQAVTIEHWRKLARGNGLDEDRVSTLVTDVATAVGDANDTAWSGLDTAQQQILQTTVGRNVDKLLQTSRASRPATS